MSPTTTAPPVPLGDVLAHTGLTYRRLDHWTRRGVLGPDLTPTAKGSGTARLWTRDAVHALAVCRRVADLAAHPPSAFDAMSGQFPLEVLGHVVRCLRDHDWPTAGWLAVTGDAATYAWSWADLGEVLLDTEQAAAIVTVLLPSDRPE